MGGILEGNMSQAEGGATTRICMGDVPEMHGLINCVDVRDVIQPGGL